MHHTIKAVHGLTDAGRRRHQNEDGLGDFTRSLVHVVVDGMGGQGDQVARTIITSIEEFFSQESVPEESSTYREAPSQDDADRLARAFEQANQHFCKVAVRAPVVGGSMATVVALLVGEDQVTIAHVGDCRCYRVRGAHIEQLTRDHSLLNEYLKNRPMTPQEIADFPHKTVLVRFFGLPWKEAVETRVDRPQAGDVYLLCSDGLHEVIPAFEMGQIIEAASDLRVACRTLVDEANRRGGTDNITALLLRW